jgi:ankyrin repeat and BTB/POZ domain-containing protein 1
MLQASRVGDVERVKYLVRREAVDVNKRDRWDSVPLYYACLAGLYGYIWQHSAMP